MRIFLTGANGFVGRVTAALLAADNEVIAPVRDVKAAMPAGVASVPFNQDLAALVAQHKPDAVINLLGIISGDFELVHVEYTRRLLEGARKCGAVKFVQMSALGAHAHSPSAYQRSKAAAERLVAGSGLPYAIARPSIISGPGQKITQTLAAAARFTPVLAVPAGMKAAPLPVETVAACLKKMAADTAITAGIYELAGSRQMYMHEYFSEALTQAGIKRLLLPLPRIFFLPLLPFFALLPNPPVTLDQYRMMGTDNLPSGEYPGVEQLLGPGAMEGL
jgi:uncharacterized protein YbjT (DUF2867 family)